MKPWRRAALIGAALWALWAAGRPSPEVDAVEGQLQGDRTQVAFMVARPIPVHGGANRGGNPDGASDQAGAWDWSILGFGVALFLASLWALWTQGGGPAELPAPLAGTRETRLLTRRKMLDKAGVPEC